VAGGTVVFFEAPHRIRRTLKDLQGTVGDCDVAVGRELTKAHEQLVRGPINMVLEALTEERGEFTVVANIGLVTEINDRKDVSPPTDEKLFGEITENYGVSRRKAVSELAKKYGMPPNKVYEAIERAKKYVV
jgi:16S rRNA (cytidine1402-2'-O)-methyltransferase